MTELRKLSKPGWDSAYSILKKGGELREEDYSKHLRDEAVSGVQIDGFEDVVSEALGELRDGKKEASRRTLVRNVRSELDLTPRQASNPEIWNYLSLVEEPEFVEERWGFTKNRWVRHRSSGKSGDRHAYFRPWMLADILDCQNEGYELAEVAVSNQDVVNQLFGSSLFQNSSAARAFVQVYDTRELVEDEFRFVAKRLRSFTSTKSFEGMSEDEIVELGNRIVDKHRGEEDSGSGGILGAFGLSR